MGNDILCVTIENKAGVKNVVPLSTWENGLKLDADWHVYQPQKIEQPLNRVKVVELEVKAAPKAPMIPPPPPAAQAKDKPAVTVKRKPGRKAKGK